jgi:hypothetical protein
MSGETVPLKEIDMSLMTLILSSMILLKGTHARDFIVRFSNFFGIIQ